MALSDEINNFSTRRTEKKEEVSRFDEDEYDEYDYEDDDEENDVEYNFKFYELDELDKLNNEIENTFFWSSPKKFFEKGIHTKVGILIIKVEKLLSSHNFEGIKFKDTDASLLAVENFSKYLLNLHKRRFMSNVYVIIFYLLMLYLTEWTLFWSIMMFWSVLDVFTKQFKYKKRKVWLSEARNYIESQRGKRTSLYGNDREEELERDVLDEVLLFNYYLSERNKESWSVELYDAVANLFKRKK